MEGGTPVVLSLLSLCSYNTLAFTARDQIKSQSHIDRSRSRQQNDIARNPTEPLLYFHTLITAPISLRKILNISLVNGLLILTIWNALELQPWLISELAGELLKYPHVSIPFLTTEYEPLGMWPVHWYF